MSISLMRCIMVENAKKRKPQLMSSSTRKILRINSPSFEEEFNALKLASDHSESEGDIEEFRVSDRELLQFHESDQGEDLDQNILDSDSSHEGS
ncbi:unnamed protein product [Ceratitis capitata]|uniref:(Mediterranean fruit fly) hypothetical protein n=1 Tax=Ceratitis capitata TaxID=7213 RepID=A0A811UQ51_CERCA|nr:unnamed protein product [Ceratitis capitata]